VVGVSAVAVPQKMVSSMDTIPIFAVDLPANLTPAQKEVEMSIRILYRASVNLESSDVNQILLNLELLAFSFAWFGQVCDVCSI
jgi:hypothetical protein